MPDHSSFDLSVEVAEVDDEFRFLISSSLLLALAAGVSLDSSSSSE